MSDTPEGEPAKPKPKRASRQTIPVAPAQVTPAVAPAAEPAKPTNFRCRLKKSIQFRQGTAAAGSEANLSEAVAKYHQELGNLTILYPV